MIGLIVPRVLPLCYWGIFLSGLAAAQAGHGFALYAGLVCLAIILGARFQQIPTGTRALLLATVLLCLIPLTLGLMSAADLFSALASGLSLGGFLISLQFLAPSMDRSDLVHRVGRSFLRQPPGRRYYSISLGVNLLGMLMSISVIPLFLSMMRRTLDETQATDSGALSDQVRRTITRRSASAVQRGMSMVPMWSPVSVVMVVISSRIPDVSWMDYLPLGAAMTVILILTGRLLDHFQFPKTPPATGFRSQIDLSSTLALSVILASVPLIAWSVATQFGGTRLLGMLLAFPLVGICFFAAQALVLKRPPFGFAEIHRFFGQTSAKTQAASREILVFISIGTCAGLVTPMMQHMDVRALVTALPLGPEGILFAGVLLGLGLAVLGLSPLVTSAFIIEVFLQSPELSVPLSLLILSATLTVGLSWIASPVSYSVMTVSRELNVPIREVLLRWNLPYLLAAITLYGVILIGVCQT